jgi:hypothetical protein
LYQSSRGGMSLSLFMPFSGYRACAAAAFMK